MNNITFTLTDLSLEEVNYLIAGLQEAPIPAKFTNPLTNKIKQQAEAQLPKQENVAAQ